MSNKKARLAMVGIGGWSATIVRNLIKCPAAELVACFSRSKENRESFAKEYHCEPKESLESLLKDKSIQGVLFITPNPVHAELVILAAQHGKHCFVDKPIANTLAEAQRMVKTCREQKVLLAVGHNSRRRQESRMIRKLIDQGDLGPLVSLECNFSHGGGKNLTADKWRWHNDKNPGGPLNLLGSHHIDTINYLVNARPKLVSALFSKTFGKSETPDITSTIIQYENGVQAVVQANYITAYTFYLHVHGARQSAYFTTYQNYGELVVSGDTNWSALHSEYQLCRFHGGSVADASFQEEINEFALAVTGQAQLEVSGEEAIKVVAIMEAAVQSAKTGRTVEVSAL